MYVFVVPRHWFICLMLPSCSVRDHMVSHMFSCVMSVCMHLRIDTVMHRWVCICSATGLVYMGDTHVLLSMRSDVCIVMRVSMHLRVDTDMGWL